MVSGREISEHQSDVEKIARAFSVTPKILLDTDQAKIGCKHVALEGFVVGNGALAELSADDIIQASHLPIHHVEEIGISGKKKGKSTGIELLTGKVGLIGKEHFSSC